jgi:hypothetical protein
LPTRQNAAFAERRYLQVRQKVCKTSRFVVFLQQPRLEAPPNIGLLSPHPARVA